MKLFKGRQKENLWAIKLVEEEGTIILAAVDSKTGEEIGYLLEFEEDGTIVRNRRAKGCFISMGYSPYEHENKWDEEGRIIIN